MKSREVSVLILYKDNKFLLQHRTDDSPRLPGYWGFFGGGIEKGETASQAVVRELYEELEYKIKSPKEILYHEYNLDDTVIKLHVFLEEYDKSQKLVLHEGKGYGFKTIEEIRKLKVISGDLEVLEKVSKMI